MVWTNALLYFVVGLAAGALLTRLFTRKSKQEKEVQKELDKTRYELEQYRQELVDHFAQSAGLLDNIAKDYSKLYQHMAKTSGELMPNLPEQDNPFASRISHISAVDDTEAAASENVDADNDEKTEEETAAPKDYSNGATGLLSGDSSIEKTEPTDKAS